MFKKFGQAALPLLLVFAMGTSLLINQRVAHAADTIAIAMIGGTTTCTQALAEGADADDDTPADGSASIKICGYIEDADEAAKGGVPVVITVSVGVLSTGTAKSVTVISDSSGLFSTNYRGAGGVATTDTVIASYSAGNAVDTETVTLDAPTGNTAATMKFNSPAKSAIAATRDKGTLNYLSPTTKTDLTLQVTDAAGLGVNSQTVLVTVDKGFIVTGLSGTCGTAKSLTGTTATAAPVSGATAIAGVVQMTICADQDATPGAITVTAQNISTSMANATQTVNTAGGRPEKIEATVTGNVINVTVTDSAGNNVANSTPVTFTISSQAGAVSPTCMLTSSGKASTVVALNGDKGTVIVSADNNSSGSASTCSSAGSRQITTSATIGAAATVAGPGTAGGFATAPVYSASKLAQAVFNGGSVADLEKAVSGANGTGVWAQDSKGIFVLYIVNGGFVNDTFVKAFPNGFSGVTAVTVVGK